MLYAYAFPKNLGFLTCQILLFKSAKSDLRKKFSNKSKSKTFMGKQAQRERNPCRKIGCNNFLQQNKINTIKIC